MKKRKILFGLSAMLFFVASCTEDIVIDLEDGTPMIGVDASFTDEMKHHETILSYTAGFYDQEVKMIKGASVYVTDGIDTFYYHEDASREGHYLTDLVAGRKNTFYRLFIDVESEGELLHLKAESFMPNNVESIDSVVVKPFNGGADTVPNVIFGDTIEWLYPYFMSLPDQSIVYMPMVTKNDTLLTDTLTQRMVIPVGGYAGYYINGPEMQAANKEIPIHMFRKSTLRDGDRIHVDLYSIPADYLMYVYSMIMSSGSNPMMGAPTNVYTNIQPSDRAVGWFLTASVASKSTVFEDW